LIGSPDSRVQTSKGLGEGGHPAQPLRERVLADEQVGRVNGGVVRRLADAGIDLDNDPWLFDENR